MSSQHGRPSRLPLLSEVAAMLRAGEPLADIASRYGVQVWAEQALCAQIGGDAWFPDKGTPDEPQTNPVSLKDAKRVCLACPVRTPCLDYALKHDERFGVWGGLSERERRRLKRQREAS